MSLARLSLRDLEYAVAVADELHFGRAAERCHVSQPALSAQVKKLEETLGAALFERGPRAVIVTPTGARLIGQARLLLREAQRLTEIAAASDGLTGELRIDAIATLGPYLVPHFLKPLRRRFPEVDFVFREGRTEQIMASLLAGESDFALISTPVRADGIETLPLFDEPFVAIHPADLELASGRPLRVADLDGEQMVSLEEGHCLRDQALALCGRSAGRQHRHATSLETLRHLVAAGLGYSLLPALAAERRESFGGLLRYTPLTDRDAFRTIALVHRRRDPRGDHYAMIADVIRSHLPPCVRPVGARSGEGA